MSTPRTGKAMAELLARSKAKKEAQGGDEPIKGGKGGGGGGEGGC